MAVLSIIGAVVVSGETPADDASLNTIASYYIDNDSALQFTGLLLFLAAFFFLIFSTKLFGILRREEGETGGLSAFGFAGGILFAVGLTIFAGINFAGGVAPEDVDPVALQTINILNNNMFFPLALGVAVFDLASGIGIVKTGMLPKWLGWVAIVAGVAALTPAGFFSFLLLGLWTLVVSVMLAMRAETA
ncbi:MAG: hypothetical protein EXQ70_06190 [Solirubrobacterales bacterium]|nr:hypothetical protein [Solirubrobacterales bacterium]